jgi:peptidoglycan/xylan/chitin deacetylase (PgdA/CDA1 family)
MGRRTDSLTRPQWPNGARCAVTLSFDVDAESSYLIRGDTWAKRLTSLSQGRYGITCGLPRILDLLDEHDVKATFFVPGWTAEHHAAAIGEILRSGHEIGHHGYLHERPDTLSPMQERSVMQQGLEAIERAIGVRTVGYRSPAWEITPTTLELLNEFGFLYDSSGMGQDVPYVESHGTYSMLELPVQWLLDDWPLFGFNGETGQIANPSRVYEIWSEEFDGLYEERGYFMLTMHPEVSGRPHRIALLDRLIRHVKEKPDVWWATGEQVARHCRAG